jgi:hypothetical protein
MTGFQIPPWVGVPVVLVGGILVLTLFLGQSLGSYGGMMSTEIQLGAIFAFGLGMAKMLLGQ